MVAITAGKPAPYSHNIDGLLASQLRWVVETFEGSSGFSGSSGLGGVAWSARSRVGVL